MSENDLGTIKMGFKKRLVDGVDVIEQQQFRKFVELVRLMRSAQKDYFKQRTKAALNRSKSLEWDVDTAVQNILYPQPSLFE